MSAIYKQPRLFPLYVHKICIIDPHALPCSMLPCMIFASPSTSRSYGRKVAGERLYKLTYDLYRAGVLLVRTSTAYWSNHVIRMGLDETTASRIYSYIYRIRIFQAKTTARDQSTRTDRARKICARYGLRTTDEAKWSI